MERTLGVCIERNNKGIPIFAHVDLKKYGAEFREFLSIKGIEVEESPYNPKFVSKIKAREKEDSVSIDYHSLWK
ncbi:hypothetical protein AGMMS50239_35290 [Bacteroidia bacterium]|nr:hypothetical protein AGMMS50239_35290 [Bacteroidia bacterium]